MSEEQLPIPNIERVEVYDLDPQRIAVFFGKNAKPSHYHVLVDTKTGSEISRDLEWQIIITEPTRLSQLIVFISPGKRRVGVVGRGGIDLTRTLRNPNADLLDSELPGPEAGCVTLEGISSVEFSRSPFSDFDYKSVCFITKQGSFTAKLMIDSKAQFRHDVFVKDNLPEGAAIRIDENV